MRIAPPLRLDRALALAFLLLCCTAGPTRAHELGADRLTIVQRDPRHLSLQFRVDLPALLHRALAPQRPQAEFILATASQDSRQIAATLGELQARLERGLQLQQDKQALSLSHWRWPQAVQVQDLLRQRAMALVAGGEAGHEHGEATEFSVEALASEPVTMPSLQLAPALQPLLVISYRPHQQWMARGQGALRLTF